MRDRLRIIKPARDLRRILARLLLLCVWSLPASAATVHTWTDAEGVTHFSDEPPRAGTSDGTAEAATIHIPDQPAAAPGADDYYSITNQWERLRAERAESRALALERRRVAAAERAAAQEPSRGEVPGGGGYRGIVPLFNQPWGFGQRRFGHGFGYGNGGGAANRGDYIAGKRRAGFIPSEVPAWPRQR